MRSQLVVQFRLVVNGNTFISQHGPCFILVFIPGHKICLMATGDEQMSTGAAWRAVAAGEQTAAPVIPSGTQWAG